MKKVAILGCPGSGKTTFSRKLRDITGLPVYHLDSIWHKPDKTTVSREEFDLKLKEILALDEWIIDGNYSRTCRVRLDACDTVFMFDLPVELCLSGAEARVGKKRPEFPWIEEHLDEEFKQWIIDFPKNNLPALYEYLEEYKEKKNIIIFKTRKAADDYLEKLKINIQQ